MQRDEPIARVSMPRQPFAERIPRAPWQLPIGPARYVEWEAPS
jgi:hypothetical protein